MASLACAASTVGVQVHQTLNEIVIGGQVMEVTAEEVARTIQELQK